MKSLMELVSAAKGGKQKDDPAAARALCAAGNPVDPQHEACQADVQALSRRLGGMPWDHVLSVYRRSIVDGFTTSVEFSRRRSWNSWLTTRPRRAGPGLLSGHRHLQRIPAHAGPETG